jgi:predicted metal-binding membrane protein
VNIVQLTDEPNVLERLLRRDRQIVTVSLVFVVAFAWIYTIAGAGMGMSAFEMSRMPWMDTGGQSMDMTMSGTSSIWVLFVMWWVMMVAMMLPSAAPTILLTAALNRRSTPDHPPFGAAAFFALGYLFAWMFFSLAAAVAQWVLESNGLLSSMMNTGSSVLAAGFLLAAGVWQFSSIKRVCLHHCRSPAGFIIHHRRPGNRGALVMGLHHGTYCLGCCWFLMALLFVGGVMNLYWIAGLALFVLIEKFFAEGVWFGRVAGAGLLITGAAFMVF